MPSVNLKPQANGANGGWSSIVGASNAFEAIDDSDTTTHDSDTTYIVLPRLAAGAGTVSFPFFCGSEHLIPATVTIRAAMKIATGAPEVEVGFYKGGLTAFSVTTVTPGAGYNVSSTSFTTNPFNASPWAVDDLANMEVCLSMQSLALGTARVSLLSVVLDYGQTLDWVSGEPKGAVIG